MEKRREPSLERTGQWDGDVMKKSKKVGGWVKGRKKEGGMEC